MAVTNVRGYLQAGLTEGGNATTGWTYTSTGNDASFSTSHALVSDTKIPAGMDGWFAVKITNFNPAVSSAGFLLAVRSTQAVGTYASCIQTLYIPGIQNSANYRGTTSGGGAANPAVTRAVQNNDIMRIRRSGTSIILEVSSDNGATFVALKVLTGQTTADIWFEMIWGDTAIVAVNPQVGIYTYTSASSAFWANVNLVFDGNSLFAGVGASLGTDDLPTTIALTTALPIKNAGGAQTNVAIAGQTWENMTSAATDVDGAWVNGKTNVLILWETTNSVFNSSDSGATAITAATTYITARRAAHPWIIVCLTTLPRCAGPNVTDQTSRDAANAQLVIADNYMRSNFAAMGLDALVDVRQSGSPYALPDYTTASFDAIAPLWNEGSGQQIHCSPAGYAIIAGYVVTKLLTIPTTPHQ